MEENERIQRSRTAGGLIDSEIKEEIRENERRSGNVNPKVKRDEFS